MNSRTIGIVAFALMIASCATTVWAQVRCDSFYPTDSLWTGWVDWNGGMPIKYNDTIKWSEAVRGWSYWQVGTWPTNTDSVVLYYDEFYNYGNYTADLYWKNGVNPISRQASQLYPDLGSGYYLGTKTDATGWLRFTFPPPDSWPQLQKQSRVLVGWCGDNASPAGVYGKAYGYTGNSGTHKPLLCIFYH